MMRLPLVLALALALAIGTTPVAAAARDSMEIQGPETMQAPQGVGEATLLLQLRVEDFYCSQPRTFVVKLNATSDVGISAYVPPELVFQVPAGSYLIDPFEARATFNLTVAATTFGSVVVFALFEAAEDDCIAPGGFPAAQVGASVRVEPTTSPPPEPTPTTPPPAETPPANDTDASGDGTVPAESPSPTPPPADPATCAPSQTCGFIGDFEPETVDESSLETPFVGLALVVAALAVALVVSRKR